MVASDVCGSSLCIMLRAIFLEPRILRWRLNFWQVFGFFCVAQHHFVGSCDLMVSVRLVVSPCTEAFARRAQEVFEIRKVEFR
jgi:hypothetical protein